MYNYEADITCKVCGKVTTFALVSVNPNKTRITQEKDIPTSLNCGHAQIINGTPVKRVRGK